MFGAGGPQYSMQQQPALQSEKEKLEFLKANFNPQNVSDLEIEQTFLNCNKDREQCFN